MASGVWPSQPILAACAAASLFPDSKSLVDRPLKLSRRKVAAAFDELTKSGKRKLSDSTVLDFVDEHFLEIGSDLVRWEPEDWTAKTDDWLPLLQDPMREWAFDLNKLWRSLCRKTGNAVTSHPDRHSLIGLPHPMLIAGDRFLEIYYWDSYWIVKGLLVCGMVTSAEHQIRNLLSMVERFGHVPNGSRVYYLNRSQPPLLSAMVKLLWEEEKSMDFLRHAVPLLMKEYEYWTSGHHVVKVIGRSGRSHVLSRYWAAWESPRSESYREDCQTAEESSRPSHEVWRDIASCAESGWDFSSRWLGDGNNLHSVQTTKVVPVDLNAFLFRTEKILIEFLLLLDAESSRARQLEERVAERQLAFDDVFWDAGSAQWRDFVIGEQTEQGLKGKPTEDPFISNWFPAWAGIEPGFDPSSQGPSRRASGDAIVQSLTNSGLILPGGVATSLNQTGHQWDFPNAWPPCQEILIEGMRNVGTSGEKLAEELAIKWLQTNFLAWQKGDQQMHEKYDSETPGSAGGGGEYAPQVGFGWTNGVALVLLERFEHRFPRN
ncbi:hypothetical protein BSKO_01425 [Bryopsis sp. KO-2023]|nr:hypothetical protein BSKO_01425 [Bryopsis sp. KO-2023]